MTFNAPRILNDPVACAHSALSKTCPLIIESSEGTRRRGVAGA